MVELLTNMMNNTMVNMKWTEIKAYAETGALVLLPLGVIEEHGPHLCLGTDIYTAHVYCLSLKEKLEAQGHQVVIAPPFYWGVCQSTGGFVGSFSIRKETASALLFDILASLKGFGFKSIFGVNAHGDIDHSLAIIEAFKNASEQLEVNACYAFDEWRLPHFGFSGDEPYLCPIETLTVKVGDTDMPDVHGGDLETAIMNYYFPHLVDVSKAKSLPPVSFDDGNAEKWLFGGHIKELSHEGYIGSPSKYVNIDVEKYINDYTEQISKAILERI